MKLRKNKIVCLFAVFLFASCGDDVTKVVSGSRMESALRVESLPECSPDLARKILYVVESGAGYVCGDSGWTPLSAPREKLSCDLIALEDSSGYKMICDGDSVGVVKNGENGANGALGVAGVAAKDGDGCSIAEGENGRYFRICGADTTLLYHALCDGVPFDIKVNFCYDGGIFAKPVFDTLVDGRDSSVYWMVKIGNQEWMAEDLRLEVSESLPNDPKKIMDSLYTSRDAMTTIYHRIHWLYADSAADGVLSRGRLYPWNTPDSVRKTLCPAGTHLPSTDEWNELVAFVEANGQGMPAAFSLQAKYGWYDDELGTDEDKRKLRHAADLFGFSALPIAIQQMSTDDGRFITGRGEYDGIYAFYLMEVVDRQAFQISSERKRLGTAAVVGGENFNYRFVRCLRD